MNKTTSYDKRQSGSLRSTNEAKSTVDSSEGNTIRQKKPLNYFNTPQSSTNATTKAATKEYKHTTVAESDAWHHGYINKVIDKHHILSTDYQNDNETTLVEHNETKLVEVEKAKPVEHNEANPVEHNAGKERTELKKLQIGEFIDAIAKMPIANTATSENEAKTLETQKVKDQDVEENSSSIKQSEVLNDAQLDNKEETEDISNKAPQKHDKQIPCNKKDIKPQPLSKWGKIKRCCTAACKAVFWQGDNKKILLPIKIVLFPIFMMITLYVLYEINKGTTNTNTNNTNTNNTNTNTNTNTDNMDDANTDNTDDANTDNTDVDEDPFAEFDLDTYNKNAYANITYFEKLIKS